MNNSENPPTFEALGLPRSLLETLQRIGYETPSPIQARAIPILLQGGDVLGQAQTGTGKTAAFALPLLARIDVHQRFPQLLVLTPTRELAIQVAEAFQHYAHDMRGFHVLPLYGGQGYATQLRQLGRGAQVIVGTPGRVIDHLRRGTLDISMLRALVLDEADEMLRMGFIEDVQWILEQAPASRQTALFSATMPSAVRKIADRHMRKPLHVTIKVKQAAAETIRQRHLVVDGRRKLDALTRILEVEPFEAMLIFVRTKHASSELAERLEARGFAAAALNGDLVQSQREAIVERLKSGRLDILVATDVVARGLDVERISHVINFDVPHDTEAYIHRIGRTGRAGRKGEAILFVTPRERRMLAAIERATKGRIPPFEMPSAHAVNAQRLAAFRQRVYDELDGGKDLSLFADIVAQCCRERECAPEDIAAALASLVQGNSPLLIDDVPPPKRAETTRKHSESGRKQTRGGHKRGAAPGMDRYRVEVGSLQGIEARHLVGAIANELGIDGEFIGEVCIGEKTSTVDLPAGMPREVFRDFKKVWLGGCKLRPVRIEGGRDASPKKRTRHRSRKPAR